MYCIRTVCILLAKQSAYISASRLCADAELARYNDTHTQTHTGKQVWLLWTLQTWSSVLLLLHFNTWYFFENVSFDFCYVDECYTSEAQIAKWIINQSLVCAYNSKVDDNYPASMWKSAKKGQPLMSLYFHVFYFHGQLVAFLKSATGARQKAGVGPSLYILKSSGAYRVLFFGHTHTHTHTVYIWFSSAFWCSLQKTHTCIVYIVYACTHNTHSYTHTHTHTHRTQTIRHTQWLTKCIDLCPWAQFLPSSPS